MVSHLIVKELGGSKMSVYKKLVKTTDQRFTGRNIEISTPKEQSSIPVPDTVVLCDGCNKNIYPENGYLVYLGKLELAKDLPYDFYCDTCVRKYFPKAILVE